MATTRIEETTYEPTLSMATTCKRWQLTFCFGWPGSHCVYFVA